MLARSVKSDQRLVRMMSVKLTGTGTASVGGTSQTAVSLTDNGVGDWTLTFATPFERAPEVVVTSETPDTVVSLAAVVGASVQILATDLAGAAKDADLHVMIIGSDADLI